MRALCLDAIVAIVSTTFILGGTTTACVWRAEDELFGLVLCLRHVGSRDQTQVPLSPEPSHRSLYLACHSLMGSHTKQADEAVDDHLTGKEAEA